VDAPGTIHTVLGGAIRKVKAEVYRHLNLRLTYQAARAA